MFLNCILSINSKKDFKNESLSIGIQERGGKLMRKLWMKPELTILVKRKSDEVILSGCKDSIGGANTKNGVCLLGNCDGPCNAN